MKKYVEESQIVKNGLIHVGDKVAVIDGSYMLSAKLKPTPGKSFKKGESFEEMEVVAVNTPFPTNVLNEKYLKHQNNCSIINNNGEIFYCSLINIKRVKNG